MTMIATSEMSTMNSIAAPKKSRRLGSSGSRLSSLSGSDGDRRGHDLEATARSEDRRDAAIGRAVLEGDAPVLRHRLRRLRSKSASETPPSTARRSRRRAGASWTVADSADGPPAVDREVGRQRVPDARPTRSRSGPAAGAEDGCRCRTARPRPSSRTSAGPAHARRRRGRGGRKPRRARREAAHARPASLDGGPDVTGPRRPQSSGVLWPERVAHRLVGWSASGSLGTVAAETSQASPGAETSG